MQDACKIDAGKEACKEAWHNPNCYINLLES